ncbi:MAG: DUF6049 family protein [Candidatus Nanopelagicales bacterium]
MTPRRRPFPRTSLPSPVALLLTALLCAALLAPLLLAAPGPAAAAEDDPATVLQVSVENLAPAVPTPDGTLVVSGRVSNTADVPVTEVEIRLRLSTIPLLGRAEIESVVDGASNYDGLAVDGTRERISERLRPGGEASFRLEVPFTDLPLSATGVYVLGVEALGRYDGLFDRQGLTRTFLPWVPYPEQLDPSRLVTMWPIVDFPSRDAAGVLVTDRTPRELSPGGRLRTLVDVGAAAPGTVSWIVDPEVLQTAEEMSEGYQVLVAGTVEPGERADDAASWLTAVRGATGTLPVRVLPYADVDGTALRRAGLDRDLVRATTLAPPLAGRILDREVTGGLYWAPGGNVDKATLELLIAAGVDAVIISDTVMPPKETLPFTPSGTGTLNTGLGSMRAILTDSGLTAALSMPQRTRGQVLLARQAFLAQTAMVTLELPSTPRTVVAAPSSPRWNPNASLVREILATVENAPWITPTSLETLIAARPSEVRRARKGYGDGRKSELPPAFLARIADAQEELARFADVVDDPAGLTEPFSAALIRCESSAWRQEPRTGDDLLRRVEDELAADIDRVRVLSRGTVTFSGDRGVVPVTIANDLDRSVTVGLRLVGIPPLRLESEPVTDLTLAPGRKTSVEVDARVVGSGTVDVAVQLTTPQGQPYGAPVAMELRSTAYARAAGWVIAAAGVALVVIVVVGTVRRIRAATRKDPS